jgi:transposase
MGRKGVETTIEERKMITNLHNQCKSLAEISRKMLQNNSRSGRPRKINQHIGRVIIKMIKRNPEISAIKITEYLKNSLNIGVSISTVRSFVRKQGFHGRVTRRKYFLSETNRKKKS